MKREPEGRREVPDSIDAVLYPIRRRRKTRVGPTSFLFLHSFILFLFFPFHFICFQSIPSLYFTHSLHSCHGSKALLVPRLPSANPFASYRIHSHSVTAHTHTNTHKQSNLWIFLSERDKIGCCCHSFSVCMTSILVTALWMAQTLFSLMTSSLASHMMHVINLLRMWVLYITSKTRIVLYNVGYYINCDMRCKEGQKRDCARVYTHREREREQGAKQERCRASYKRKRSERPWVLYGI